MSTGDLNPSQVNMPTGDLPADTRLGRQEPTAWDFDDVDEAVGGRAEGVGGGWFDWGTDSLEHGEDPTEPMVAPERAWHDWPDDVDAYDSYAQEAATQPLSQSQRSTTIYDTKAPMLNRRTALGLAALAMERMPGGRNTRFATGVGLLLETADGLRALRSSLATPELPKRAAQQARAMVSSVVTRARERGTETIEASQVDARALLRRITSMSTKDSKPTPNMPPLEDR